ncbi:shikimate dehydrogenase [Leptolyngbya sp. FACHB-261]|uniref:shikimate dehydrogenase n=1 Tax=Leptolyngbya sp. FACHB-261 TaxID=2692806 RepID=UPI001684A8D2|nr:shikimate dehydrogenase [Leptolyngbya sp. FACHB-261]MBD2105122.1 shikimate dehydrogenase [Leptolyngbya sp. FACHB-261]
MITGKTALLGIVGHPVEHSLSPAMHNAALTELGLNWAYVPFPVAPEHLKKAVEGFEAIGLRGFNVTIPHKQAILSYLSEISPLAQAVGAVNTVKRTSAGWSGTNTDVEGFIAPLRQQSWLGAVAVILGNGGAARAVVAGCGELGFDEIWVVGRDAGKLSQFAASWSGSKTLPPKTLRTCVWADLKSLLPQASLLVNTTPIGMHPHTDATPLTASELDQTQTALVYDLIYTPRPTQLLHQAQQRGLSIQDGLEMLVQQGAAALTWWTERTAPTATMRQAALRWLDAD